MQPDPNPAPPTGRGPDDTREAPDYDGRSEPTTVGDVALWVPRVVLFPLYVVSEYVIRRPLGWLLSTAERERWPMLIVDFVTFGDRRQGGIVPTASIDLGMRASVGVYAFWNDFLFVDNELRFRGTYGGGDTYQLRLTDRFPLGDGTLALNFAFESRPDNVFYGIGREHVDQRSRYYSSTTRGGLSAGFPGLRSSYYRVRADLRHVQLDGDEQCCGDPSVQDRVSAGDFPVPPGMGQDFDVADQVLEVVLDSRWPRFPELEPASDYVAPPGTGVRFAMRGSHSGVMDQSLAPGPALADDWVHFGASLGGHLDVTGQQRAVSATVIVDFAEPLGAGEVPVTDLVSLGGDRPLRGFLANQFLDRSAAAMRFEYRWPVAVWLDGTLQYELGNVFGRWLSGFELGELRSSFGIGLAAVGAQDHTFQALVAFGTTPYSEGGRVDSFRLVLGTTAGF